MLAKVAILLAGRSAFGIAVRPGKELLLLRTEHRAANATLTSEDSQTLDSAAACGADINDSYAKVDSVVGAVNSTALDFLDTVTAAIITAGDKLVEAQSAASTALAAVGVDGSSLADLVDAVSAKVSTTLTAVNETNDNLKAALLDVLTQYQEGRDAINESLALAISSTRTAALEDAEKEEAEAAANASASNTSLAARPMALRQKHAASVQSPKGDAAKAIATMNSTADKLIGMLGQLNTTVLAALSAVIDTVNSSAHSAQDLLLSGLAKLPAGVPDAATTKMTSTFDAVFVAIDAISPANINTAIAPTISEATEQVAEFQSCIEPLGSMVEDLDAAWSAACSWPLLFAFAAASVSRTVLQ